MDLAVAHHWRIPILKHKGTDFTEKEGELKISVFSVFIVIVAC